MWFNILFYPFYTLIGYVFLIFKYTDDERRKEVLSKEYENSYALAGKIITSQAAVGILAILIGGILIIFVFRMIYDAFIK